MHARSKRKDKQDQGGEVVTKFYSYHTLTQISTHAHRGLTKVLLPSKIWHKGFGPQLGCTKSGVLQTFPLIRLKRIYNF
jgi:hypothetical protein